MRKLSTLLEETFMDVAFAEHNQEPVAMAARSSKSTKSEKNLGRWLEDSGAAVAFAGAGDHETAMQMTGRKAESEKKQEETPMILVVGSSHAFSNELIRYAVDMAGRIKGCIMALNVGVSAEDTDVRQFASAAKEQGVSFEHLARKGNRDMIVEALSRKYSNLQYVMTEPGRPKAKKIPVYRPAPAVRARPRARSSF